MTTHKHPSRQRSSHFLYTAVGALWVALGGCTTLSWGNGGLGDELPAGAMDPNGLVRVLGNEDVAAAAARLTNQVPTRWAEGVRIDEQVALDVDGAELIADLVGVVIAPGLVQLAWSPDGLVMRVGVTVEPAEDAPDATFGAVCAPEMAAEGVALELRLGLGTDKLGRVQVALLDAPRFVGDGLDVDWADCLDGVFAAALDGVSMALWDALAEVAADAIAPALLEALPPALGLDLATGAAGTVASDAVGAGFARLSVEASAPDGGTLWRPFGEGQRLVPFGVGIAADAHPCMPALVLPPAGQTPLPVLGAAAASTALVGAQVVRRAIAAAWLAGAACGEHATGGVALRARELAPAWPALERLPGDTLLTVAVWPREVPSVGLAIHGADRVTLATGLMDVDLYAELDGASVRLASMTVGAEVEVSVMVGASGLVSLAPQEVRLVASGAREGLFEAPPLGAAEAVLVPIVTALVGGRPIFKLPVRPATSTTTRARVTAEHVAIPM